MSEYDEYGSSTGAPTAPVPTSLPPGLARPPAMSSAPYHPGATTPGAPAHTLPHFNRKMSGILRPTNLKTSQRPMVSPAQHPAIPSQLPPQMSTASAPQSPSIQPPPAGAAPAAPQGQPPMAGHMSTSMTSSSDTDEYGQRTTAALPSVAPRLSSKIQPRSSPMSPRPGAAAPIAPGSGRFPNSPRGAAPPPPQALGGMGMGGNSGVDEYGSPRVMGPPPLTASGRAPPTGKFSSPIAKQQQTIQQINSSNETTVGSINTNVSLNASLNASLNVSVNNEKNGSGPVAPPIISAPQAPKLPVTTSSDQDDEYGTSSIQAPIHLPVKQPQAGSFPLSSSMSPSGPAPQAPSSPAVVAQQLSSSVAEMSPRRVVPAFKAPSIHKNQLSVSAPPVEVDEPVKSSNSSPVIAPGSPVMAQSGSTSTSEETLGVLKRSGSVKGYSAEPAERHRKERVNHTEFISVPKYLSEKPIRGIYSLNATNRSDWKARVLANNPNIGELYERIYPLERGIAFCKMFHPGQRAVKEEMKQTQVIQLILQHLQLKGFNATRRVLEKESRINTPRHRLHTSRLNSFIHAAIRDTDAVYDYVIGEKIDFGKQIEDKLWQMGLQEEEEESEEIDIWQEPPDRVRYETENDPKSNVKCGSFNKLVELLTGEYTMSHPEYLPTFFLTYQSFSTPERLLQKLVQRFNVPQSVSSQQSQLGQQNPVIIRGRVCNIMRKWIEEYPYDFDEKLNVQMKQFIDYVASNSAISKLIVPVNNSFQKMLAESMAPKKVQRTSEPPEPIIPQNFFSRRWDQWLPMELDEEEIARQLSLIDWEYFKKIKPTELLNQAWSKPKLKHRAQNVLAFIAQFNRTSAWAATEIMSAPTIRERVKVIAKLVKISEKLSAMNNYNSLMSISAALNCSSVSRLKHTFAELPPYVAKGKKDIDELVSSDGNFKILRQRIASIDPSTTPCIPYLGYILSDLTFTDENPDKIMGMINFNKRVMVYRIINGIISRQMTPYNFQPVQQIVRILRRVPLKPENELYELSLKHEPRGAQRNQIK